MTLVKYNMDMFLGTQSNFMYMWPLTFSRYFSLTFFTGKVPHFD